MVTEQVGFQVAATLAAALIRQQSHPTPESAAEAFYKVLAELERQKPGDDVKASTTGVSHRERRSSAQ